MNQLIIHQFPCLSDNYGFLVHDPVSNKTACIDTPDADEILHQLELKGWSLSHILNTHHHADHAGGNLQLKKVTNCTIVGAKNDAARIPGLDIGLAEGDVFHLGEYEFLVMETPGHTVGHIIYYVAGQDILFAGDTLFSAGCGRLFEGTPKQMWESLQKIIALPDSTRIYCAHEYTQNNIAFARTIDRDNPELHRYAAEVDALRQMDKPTVPMTLEREKQVNPFLRPAYIDQEQFPGISKNNETELFAAIRQRKDSF